MGMVNVRNLGFGGTGIPDALPQAIAELQNQKFTIVAGAAANTLIVVPGMDPEDAIGSIVDLTTPATVDPATCTVQGRNASATITALATAADGDKVTVNGKPYTVRDVIVSTSYNAPPGVVAVDITPSGNDAEALAKALSVAIMSGDSTLTASVGPDVSSPPKLVVVTVKVRTPGTAGNSYTLTKTGNAFTVSGATFTGGVAAASAGFKSTVSTAGKNLLVIWYDKHPGVATAPLMVEDEDDGPSSLAKAMRFKGGRQQGPGDMTGPNRPSVGLPGTPGTPSHLPAPGVPPHEVDPSPGADLTHGFNVGTEIHEKAPNKPKH